MYARVASKLFLAGWAMPYISRASVLLCPSCVYLQSHQHLTLVIPLPALRHGCSQARLPPYRFRPLDVASEAPRPGMLLGLDAEFVMVGLSR
jgi:hypothetical protein